MDFQDRAGATFLSESEPLARGSDVLKIGHHGSKNSTTPEFLAAVQPRPAVISAGEENPYGHSSPQPPARLIEAGVPYVRTDSNGAIHIFTDGTKLEVSWFVPCPDLNANLNSVRPQAPDNQQSEQQQ